MKPMEKMKLKRMGGFLAALLVAVAVQAQVKPLHQLQQEFEDLRKRVETLEKLIQDVVWRATSSNGSGVANSINPTYLWVGTKADYNSLDSHPTNTVFMTSD